MCLEVMDQPYNGRGLRRQAMGSWTSGKNAGSDHSYCTSAEFISTQSRVAFVLIAAWISWVDQLINWVFPELIKKVWMSSWVSKTSMGKGYTRLSTEYGNWMTDKMNFKESNMLELASTCAFLPCDWGCQTSWKCPQGDWKWQWHAYCDPVVSCNYYLVLVFWFQQIFVSLC